MSNQTSFAKIEIGDAIPEMTHGPISRTRLALFAGASGDHNPIHLDEDAAKAGGLPGVIIHGMLMMAMLGQMLTKWVVQTQIKGFSNRFVAMARPGDTITASGVVAAKRQEDGKNLVDLDIIAQTQNGDVVLKGTATIIIAA